MGERSSHEVAEPGFMESLIPLWGSGRQSIHDFQQGKYIQGTLWGVMAASDALMVGILAKAGIQMVGKIGMKILIEEGGREAGTGLASGTYRMARVVGRTSSAVVRDVATGAREMAVRAWQPDKWRAFGNMGAFLRKSRENWWKLVWNNQVSKAARNEYWELGRVGRRIAQHHWLIQDQTTWIKQGFRNARLNYLEIPSKLNSWMAGIATREVSFRLTVVTAVKADFLVAYKSTESLIDRAWDYCLSNPPKPAPQEKK
jgi:hypothetical protein